MSPAEPSTTAGARDNTSQNCECSLGRRQLPNLALPLGPVESRVSAEAELLLRKTQCDLRVAARKMTHPPHQPSRSVVLAEEATPAQLCQLELPMRERPSLTELSWLVRLPWNQG